MGGNFLNNTTKGAITMILSSISMTMMSVMVKFTGEMPLFQQVFFRNLVMAIFAGVLIYKQNGSYFGYKENRRILFFRSTFGFLGVLASFYATKNLYLGDAQALLKVSPFVVTILAVLFLNEKITKTRIFTMVLAFIGALIIINPRFNSRLVPSLIGLSAAFFSGTAYAIISFLSKKDRKESPLTIIFMFAVWSMVYTIPFVFRDFHIPDIKTLVFLVLIGVFASLGQFLLTTAYSIADASKISIFDYVSLIASAIFGNLFFGEVLPIQSIIGIFIIIISAYISFINSREKKIAR